MDNYIRGYCTKNRYFLPLYALLLCFSQWLYAASVSGKVTHSLNVPSSGTVGSSVSVSWSPLSEFSTIDFSFVKLGYRINGGAWTFRDLRGSGTSISLTQSGSWCFIVRGWDSTANQFGLFGSERCTTVQNAPVPSAPSTPTGPIYHPINSYFSISWNPVAYASYYELNGERISNTSKDFSYSNYGQKSFQVRACNAQGQCSALSPVKYVTVYTGPGAPTSPSVSKTTVETGEHFTVSWGRPGGAVPGLYYIVKRNNVQICTGSSTSCSDVIYAAGSYTYTIAAWNPNNLAGGTSSVSVQVIPKVVVPNTPIVNITRNGSDAFYIPTGKTYNVTWNQQNNVSYSVTEVFNGTSENVGSVPLTNLSKSHYGNYTYIVKASNSAGSVSGQKNLYIYSSPGFVGVPAQSKTVFENEIFNLEWTAAGGMIPTGDYQVWLNGAYKGSTQNTNYGPLSHDTAGTYRYTIKSCNPELSCTNTTLAIEVKKPDEPVPIEGVGELVLEKNTSEIVDYYYNKNEYLVWDVSQIKNAHSFKVTVQQLPEHIDGGTRTNLKTFRYDAQLNGQYVKFKFGEHIDDFESGQWVRITLTPCHVTQCQSEGQTQTEIVLVNWNNNQYFQGTPQHIASIAGETDSIGNFIFNKLWPRAVGQNANSSGGNPFHYFYELEATQLMDAYMFPYAILPNGKQPDKSGEIELDTSKKLFDGISIWNMPARLSGFDKLNDTITESALIPTFKTTSKRHFWREFFDNVFGVKRGLKLQKVGEKGVITDFNSRYLLKPETFTNIHGNSETRPRSLLEGIHASASKATGQFKNDRGVYIMLPAPLNECIRSDDNYKCVEFAAIDEDLYYKRLTLYIDEVIEQYTIFKNLYKASPVKLAGFKWSKESARPQDTELCTEGNTAMCRSVYHNLLKKLKTYINGFSQNAQSGELELVMSTYSAIVADPSSTAFSKIDCTDNETKRRDCFTRFSQMQALDYEDHFDQIWFQPNATVERFHSKRSGDVKDQAVDREVLSWYTKGLFNKLQNEPKYSILIEYTRHSGKALTLTDVDFGYSHRQPSADNPAHANYNYPSYTDRLEGDSTYPTGYYGDISYYFDYVMTQLPEPFKNGNRSFAYDDNGGVLLCYAEYVRGNKDFCNATQFHDLTTYKCNAGVGDVCKEVCKYFDGKSPEQCTIVKREFWVESWDLVESVSDVRSLYSFIEATHLAKQQGGYVKNSYLGDNNLFPEEPIIELHPSKTQSKTITHKIAVTPSQTVSAKALVRARLLESVAFKNEDSGIESCSAQPRIKLSFYKNQDDIQPFKSESVTLIPSKLQYACMTHYRRLKYSNGGKGAIKGGYSGYWPDVDMWELLARDFVVPDNAAYVSITLEAIATGSQNNLEAYLFYRPEYKIQ